MLNKRQCGSTDIVCLQSFDQKIIRFNPCSLLRKFWPKDNTVQPILSFRKFSPKRYMVQPISSFKKILTKREWRSVYIVFFENFDQKTKRFNPHCLLRQFWWNDNVVQSIYPYSLFGKTQKTIWLNPYSCLRNFWPKSNMVNSNCHVRKFWPKDISVQTMLSF